MMISLRLELQNSLMRTLRNVLGSTQGLHGMGLIVATIQRVLFSLQHDEFSFGCNMNVDTIGHGVTWQWIESRSWD